MYDFKNYYSFQGNRQWQTEGQMGLQPLQQNTYQHREIPAPKRSNFAISPSYTPVVGYFTATRHICY